MTTNHMHLSRKSDKVTNTGKSRVFGIDGKPYTRDELAQVLSVNPVFVPTVWRRARRAGQAMTMDRLQSTAKRMRGGE